MTEFNLNPLISDLALRKTAMWGSSTLGNDIYYLKECVDLIINVIGEEKFVEMLINDKSPNCKVNNEIGKNWYRGNGMKHRLRKFDKIVETTKASYDVLEDKTLNKKDIKYTKFISKATRVPMIKQDLYALYVFVILNTNLSRMTVRSEMWKILENKGSKLGDTRRPTLMGGGVPFEGGMR